MLILLLPRRGLLVAALALGSFFAPVYGQSPKALSQFDRRVISPSPQATQLGVYGNVAPDLSTGAMQLQVPVVEATSRQLRLPISLNYHYTGLLVDELPSWVGLGWTLNAGGVVTRTIRGLPDEVQRGYSAMGKNSIQALIPAGQSPMTQLRFPFPIQRTTANGALWDLSHDQGADQVDTEPDAYTLSLPGYSGKFLLDAAYRPLLSPHTDIQLGGNPGSGWVATTGDGTRYHFEAAETTQGSDERPGLPSGPFPTAWYLSRMESPDGTDTIWFEYRNNLSSVVLPANTITKAIYRVAGNIPSCMSSSGTPYNVPADVEGGSWPLLTNSQQTIYLSRITTATLRVDLISDDVRRDIAPTDDRVGRRLSAITVRERYSGRLIKRVELTQGYFSDNAAPAADPTVRRLRLDAVTEVGKPSHQFSYDESRQMPSRRHSFAKDHWGFYTGRVANTLIPSLPPTKANFTGVVAGGNREADGNESRVGSLRQVRYPTGGRTVFEYEPNVVMEVCGQGATAFGRGAQDDSPGRRDARANGGPPVPMSDLENDIAANFPSSSSSGGSGQNRSSVPTNVRAVVINVPNGGYVNSLTSSIYSCIGNTTCSPSCQYGFLPMDVRFYRMDTISNGPNSYHSLVGPVAIGNTGNDLGSGCGPVTARNIVGNMNRQLAPGQYCIVAICNSAIPSGMSAYIAIDINIYPRDTSGVCFQPRQVGGLRLKRTHDYTGQGDTLTTTYAYNAKNSTFSSGYLYFEPKYDYTNICQHLLVGAADQGKTGWLESGYHVGYGRVTVRKSSGEAGTTVHTFSTNEFNAGYPIPAALRGLVLKTEKFNETGYLLQRDTTLYTNTLTGYTHAARIYPDYINKVPVGTDPGGSTVFQDNSVNYTVKVDVERAFWPRVVRRIETSFGPAAAPPAHTQTTTHHYLPWNFQQATPELQTTQPVRTSRTASDGRLVITKTRYAGQYAQTGTDSVSLGLRTMVETGMLSVPVEQQSWVRNGADSSVVSGQLTHYFRHPTPRGPDYNGAFPRRVLQFTVTQPLAASQFSGSFVQGGTFQQDARYVERQAFTHYDPFGNLLQQRRAAGQPVSYVWGYEGSQPIAEVQNANCHQVAYTSFEPDAAGRWTYDSMGTHRVLGGRTGRWAYRLNGGWGVSRSVPAGDYELQGWATAEPLLYANSGLADQQGYVRSKAVVATAAGGWKHYRWALHLPVAAGLNLDTGTGAPTILLDEVRLYPLGAHMTSYTYDVAVGMTSQTDQTGRTLTYEYDALGRLLRTRDEQGRVLSQQQYHYARP